MKKSKISRLTPDSRYLQTVALNRSRECRNTVREEDFFNKSWPALQGCFEPMKPLLAAFKSEVREKSKMFSFWEDYIDMLLALTTIHQS